MNKTPLTVENRIRAAIAKLRALQVGNQAVLDLVACGQAAVEPLREFLFTPDPSGIFRPRCQAVEALAGLCAKDVFLDFLSEPRKVANPVEQAGEDAVTNAVARALMKWPDEHVYSLLLKTADYKLLAGVVEALGEYRRPETLPIFFAALGDDLCQPEAENAFRKMGATARRYLLQRVAPRTPSENAESESSRRQRRSAFELLAELLPGEELLKISRSLVADSDAQMALKACSICLPKIPSAEQEKVTKRLVALLDSSDWMLRAQVEDLLVQHYLICRPNVEENLTKTSGRVNVSLCRVVIRGCAACGFPLPPSLQVSDNDI